MSTTDRELQDRVVRALEFDPSVDATQVGITTHNGVVTLRGAVTTYHQRWTAERVAGRVYGVRALANEIEVLPTGDNRRSDSAIAEAAANALQSDSAVPKDGIRVTVREGWLTLSGEVPWRYQRDAAEHAVRRLYGVKGVTNAVAITPHVRVSDIKSRIEDAFSRSAVVDARHVQVEARDGAVILTGRVRSLSERREAERAAWSAPGVTMVDDRLAVTP